VTKTSFRAWNILHK